MIGNRKYHSNKLNHFLQIRNLDVLTACPSSMYAGKLLSIEYVDFKLDFARGKGKGLPMGFDTGSEVSYFPTKIYKEIMLMVIKNKILDHCVTLKI